jgi:methionyl-tRNA formyltransferase
MTSAVVFAYHNVGVRCMSVLLAQGVEVALVFTHEDRPEEDIWFASVRELAQLHRIPVVMPTDPNGEEWLTRVRACRPDFIFSFYYRQLLGAAMLAIPAQGALNLHGSLLPKYRGRVPVNWAVINGEEETGATLHYMVEKPDAGDIVDQQAVPILPDDLALDVFNKVTWAAELLLHRALPALIAGTALAKKQNLLEGGYCGGRKPEDGIIDWRRSATHVHNLVRGVAPPYPGAFTFIDGKLLRIFRTMVEPKRAAISSIPGIYVDAQQLLVDCEDRTVLRVIAAQYDRKALNADTFAACFGVQSATFKIPFDS